MTSKKNMRTNRTPRRIHRNKGGRKKGYNYGAADDEFGSSFISEENYNRLKKKYEVKN
jgi:hypothetical protein|tara:strand:+ start:6666 stop:6839 length:174 start_codon:yes stop_codon:yes gene_type:complete